MCWEEHDEAVGMRCGALAAVGLLQSPMRRRSGWAGGGVQGARAKGFPWWQGAGVPGSVGNTPTSFGRCWAALV